MSPPPGDGRNTFRTSSYHPCSTKFPNSITQSPTSTARIDASESDDEKKELEGYIVENKGVIRFMKERVGLLRFEVERRGQKWVEDRKARNEEEERAPVAMVRLELVPELALRRGFIL
jgi:predicted HicB family RNase H-like nuclease